MLGGVPVDRRTEDPGERRLVNVAEEMAIAAGLPVPALYVLPGEDGINAFAAGFTPDRAVVAVTRGALDRLDRDELQGVVAHEFSHVLNGDARLNVRLALGRRRASPRSPRSGGSSSDVGRAARRGRAPARASGAAAGRSSSAGLVIWLAGSIGAFFGKLIRAAVSRQREHLADAAAVQFTRNPEGLAGALAKIAHAGSVVESAFAPEAAHLFFANGLSLALVRDAPAAEGADRAARPAGLPPGDAARGRSRRAASPRPTEAAPRRALAAGAAASGRAGAAPVPLTARRSWRPPVVPGRATSRTPRACSARSRPRSSRGPRAAAAATLVRALLADADRRRARSSSARSPTPAPAPRSRRSRAALAGRARRGWRSLDLALPALDALDAAPPRRSWATSPRSRPRTAGRPCSSGR